MVACWHIYRYLWVNTYTLTDSPTCLPFSRRFRFEYNPTIMSWSAAKEFCFNDNGTLARARNADHFLEMRALAQEQGDSFAWIDGNDSQNEGTWICSTDPNAAGRACKVFPFAIGEPDNFGDEQHCLALWRNGQYFVSDRDCERALTSICMYKN